MPYGEYAECPHCGLIAHDREEIEVLFGYRYGGAVPQSWCRKCRSSRSDKALNPFDAVDTWMSNGMDEDYMFSYSEDELRKYI
ncbi:hypothetical protein KPC83_06715 [Collinsella sp. zg1085]|uniref:hypothetical protein n=1 Tax=Collinsella sp. zg1085 TaxID=2844380 RepID=UPI001C0C316E|nr:hypothetical protein [Collinsella sp. zg1085]QWT17521.1 hypothetical protein KPC83_06715 [Collinsella sp. zg1085]